MSDKCPDTLDMFAEPASQPTPDQLQQQAKAYARKKFDFALKKGFKPAGLHCYTAAEGQPRYWKVRLNPPSKSGQLKIIIPFHWNGSAFAKGEPVHPEAGKPLYNLHGIAQADPAAEVWIVEGEQKADALNARGLIAATSGSSSSANKTDWQPLAGRTVRIWPDFDETLAGQEYAAAVATILTGIGCRVSILDVAAIQIEGQPLPNKGDVMDWLEMREAAGLSTSAADVLSLPLVPEVEPDQPDSGEGEPDSTQNARAREGDSGLEPEEPLSEQDELTRLATLDALEYDRQRGEAAKRLGIRPVTLDKVVKGLQAEQQRVEAGQAGLPVFLQAVDPWPEPVDGSGLLDELAAMVHRHIVCSDATAQAAALWIVFSWCIDAAQVAPIAVITAPEKRCGKTQLLTLIGKLCRKPIAASSITPAAFFRSIELWRPTLLIDEADTFMKDNEELRGVINAGHSRESAYVIRTTGDDHTPTSFSVWGAKAISGIGHLPDTIRDRAVLLELRRKQPHEIRDRLRYANPETWHRLKQQLSRWSIDHIGELSQARPALPDALNDRAQDNWEILLAIAQQAGGHWPDTAFKAAIKLEGAEQHSPSVNEELLSDIRDVFERTRQTRISSVQLVDYLTEDEEGPWATWNKGRPITPRQIAKRLSEFGIKSRQLRLGTVNNHGYEKEHFKDAFKRYLSANGNLSATTLQPFQHKGSSQFTNATDGNCVADEKTLKPLQGKACSVVAFGDTQQSQEAQNVVNSDPVSVGSMPL